MYAIGSVAKMLDVPAHTVRFWTQEFAIAPHIGKGGRRYYTDDTIEQMRRIKELLHVKGMKISHAKSKLNDSEPEGATALVNIDYSHIKADLLDARNMLENALLKIQC